MINQHILEGCISRILLFCMYAVRVELDKSMAEPLCSLVHVLAAVSLHAMAGVTLHRPRARHRAACFRLDLLFCGKSLSEQRTRSLLDSVQVSHEA